jgi:hypothetical protein
MITAKTEKVRKSRLREAVSDLFYSCKNPKREGKSTKKKCSSEIHASHRYLPSSLVSARAFALRVQQSVYVKACRIKELSDCLNADWRLGASLLIQSFIERLPP